MLLTKNSYADKAGSRNEVFGTLVPISQEAFALLLYKNGYENWIWMHNNAATSEEDDDDKPGYLYMNTRGRDRLVFTSRNGGWSAVGMEEFNRLCSKEKGSHLDDKGSLDGFYKEHWRATKRPSK